MIQTATTGDANQQETTKPGHLIFQRTTALGPTKLSSGRMQLNHHRHSRFALKVQS